MLRGKDHHVDRDGDAEDRGAWPFAGVALNARGVPVRASEFLKHPVPLPLQGGGGLGTTRQSRSERRIGEFNAARRTGNRRVHFGAEEPVPRGRDLGAAAAGDAVVAAAAHQGERVAAVIGDRVFSRGEPAVD